GYPLNDTAAAITAVNLPWVSVIAGSSVFEGNSGTTNIFFSARLSAPCQFPVSVNYATSDNTARAGQDYFFTAGTLAFTPGSTNQTLAVPVIGDTIYESAESFFLNLSSPINAAIAIGQARGRILNDDAPPKLFLNDVLVAKGGPTAVTNAIF